MSITTRNIVIFIVAAIVPLVAELMTATPESVPGTGFDVLLYKPFDFAYILFVGGVFLAANLLKADSRKLAPSISLALSVWGGWFVISFLAVSQLHITLGGKL